MQHDSCADLRQTIARGGTGLFDVAPKILRNVLTDRLWATQLDKPAHLDEPGKPFQSFEAFVVGKLPWGLNTTINDLRNFCRKFQDVVDLLDKEVGALAANGEIGGGHTSSNNVRPAKHGNARDYGLRRLKRDRPDLAAKVGQLVDGKPITVNMMALEAGFRPKTWTAPDDVEKLAVAIEKRYGDRATLLAQLLLDRKSGHLFGTDKPQPPKVPRKRALPRRELPAIASNLTHNRAA